MMFQGADRTQRRGHLHQLLWSGKTSQRKRYECWDLEDEEKFLKQRRGREEIASRHREQHA